MILFFLLIITSTSKSYGKSLNETFQPVTPNLPSKKENQIFIEEQADGCFMKESLTEVICIGSNCMNYPSNYEVKKQRLRIKMTNIERIKRKDFVRLGGITVLVLEYNLNLHMLEPGCFQPMKNLTRLKMTLNYNLRTIHARVFEGLNNLTHLSLRKNGFNNIIDISQSLAPNTVPSLTFLDLSENLFKIIRKNDFNFMNSTKVDELQLSLCGLEFIHEESLLVFKNLKMLGIDGNHFNMSNLKEVILKFVEYNIPLEILNLQDSGYRKKPPVQLLKIISKTNVSALSLADNQFQEVNVGDFPKMPKITTLDLSDNIIVSIEEGSLSGFTNLKALFLAGNKFSKILPAILLPHLNILDLSRVANKVTAVSYLNIANNVFINMTNLTHLRLSFNLIESVNAATFNGLTNLKYLEMKNDHLYNILENSFMSTSELTYLNLENNPLQAITLNSKNFAKLTKLKSLFLGGCNIYNLSTEPSPFYYLTNLTYLGLNNNIIYSLTPQVFAPLVSLETLDLSGNKLSSWYQSLFLNTSLKYIDVSQNKFTLFTEAMLTDFRHIGNLNLYDNPFICDCNLFPSESIEQVLSDTRYTNVVEAKCSNTDFQQKTIRDFLLYVKDNPYLCDKSINNKIIGISLAVTFVLIFIILAILVYIYRFYVRYWLFLIKITIHHRSRWWTRHSKQPPKHFKYDAFVSYSCLDCYFVNKLVSELENNEPYLKLCVYERDFKIGSIISEEVIENILGSKRTLLVISDSFAKSQWCRWETRLAEHHRIFFQNDDSVNLDDTLVMIKLSDIQKKYITPTLKYLMKTRIYLQWDADNEKMFWQKLRNTLSAPKCGSSEN